MTANATPEPTTRFPTFRVFAPFEKVTKQDDGTLLVESVINDEVVDDQGEIVEFEAVEKASADYMQWANVREMHDPHTAAGVMVSLASDPELRKHTGVMQIVDPEAIRKVEAGVYKGTSLGGMKLSPPKMEKVGGKLVRKISEIFWNETSLVDRPSRPTAQLTLLKRSDAETAEALADVPAPEASTTAADGQPAGDVYLDATGQPLAKASEEVAEEPTPATPEPLAKSAVDDVMSLNDITNQLAIMVEREALEGDSEDVVKLRGILAQLQQMTAGEAAEIGTPEDIAQREEELAEAAEEVTIVEVVPMYYSSVIGDLAKSAVALRKSSLPADQVQRIQQLHDMAHAAGAECETFVAEIGTTDGESLSKASEAIAATVLAKVTDHITTALGQTARPADLEAVKVELLGAIGPMKEELAKIANQPQSGGPLRYAADDRRFTDALAGGEAIGSSTIAAALSKASQMTSNPVVREELGRLAAAEEIAAANRR